MRLQGSVTPRGLHLTAGFSTASEIVEAIAAGRWTASEVLEAYIARAAVAHGKTNCITEGEFRGGAREQSSLMARLCASAL